MEPSKEHLDVLKRNFGHSEFRPVQWKIIRSLLTEKRDNCVVMATGSGKSLCYQFPPVFANGLGIVVSPLISLMQDQVRSLEIKQIRATYLGSAQHSKTDIYKKIKEGYYRLLYVTPEWLGTEFAQDFLPQLISNDNVKLMLLAVDEAHCVSQWGMDFRMSYRKLGDIRKILQKIPVLAVTATATPIVREDVCKSLNLKNPLVTCTSFDRPNLFLSASLKGESIVSDIKTKLIEEGVMQCDVVVGSCIIYCPTKKGTDRVAESLNSASIRCAMYHADLSTNVKEKVHKDFVQDKLPIVVATVAFGMGIDKPDVRGIIHYGAPKEIESYYQEIGRAGRDGQPAFCHVFYIESDFSKSKLFFSNVSQKYRPYKEDSARRMEQYLLTRNCRRDVVLKYFASEGESANNTRCCDNCLKKTSDPSEDKYKKYDMVKDALLFLQAVRELNERYGVTVPMLLLRGSNSKRIPDRFSRSRLFGAGKDKPEEWWKLLGNLLVRESLLEGQMMTEGSWNEFKGTILKLTSKGHRFIENESYRETYHLEPTPQMLCHICYEAPKKVDGWYSINVGTSSAPARPLESSTVSLQEVVLSALKEFRRKVASALDCMPYSIFDNASILQMSRALPTTMDDLRRIDGITHAQSLSYGQACLDCIKKCTERYNKEMSDDRVKNVKKFVAKPNRTLRFESCNSEGARKEDHTPQDSIQRLPAQNPETIPTIYDLPTQIPVELPTVYDLPTQNPVEMPTIYDLSTQNPQPTIETAAPINLDDCFDDDDFFADLPEDSTLIEQAKMNATETSFDDDDDDIFADLPSDEALIERAADTSIVETSDAEKSPVTKKARLVETKCPPIDRVTEANADFAPPAPINTPTDKIKKFRKNFRL